MKLVRFLQLLSAITSSVLVCMRRKRESNAWTTKSLILTKTQYDRIIFAFSLRWQLNQPKQITFQLYSCLLVIDRISHNLNAIGNDFIVIFKWMKRRTTVLQIKHAHIKTLTKFNEI